LNVSGVGSLDASGLTAGSTVNISPTNIVFGSGVGIQHVALGGDVTKSWAANSVTYTEVLHYVDYIGRGADNAIVVYLEGLINSTDSTFVNQAVFFLFNATQVGGPGNILSWSGTETTSNPNVIPLPAALPLFASGTGVMGWLAWRRKRKNAAAIAA
jgi:hypothetical protein